MTEFIFGTKWKLRMTFHTSSFFVGVGTVLATMTVGFGGGVLMTNAFVGKNDSQPNKIEQRITGMAPAPVVATTSAAAYAPVERTPAPPPFEQTPAPAPIKHTPPGVSAEKPTSASVAEPSSVQASASVKQLDSPAPQPIPTQPIAVKVDQTPDKKAIAEERKKLERKKSAERRKQEAMKYEELERVAERVRYLDREDDGEPVIVRSYTSESLMD